MLKRLRYITRDIGLVLLLGSASPAYPMDIKITSNPGRSTIIQNTNSKLAPTCLTPSVKYAAACGTIAVPKTDEGSSYIPVDYGEYVKAEEAKLINLFESRYQLDYPADTLEKAVMGSRSEPLSFEAKYNGSAKTITYDRRCETNSWDSMTIVAVDRDITPNQLLKKQVVKDVVASMFRDDLKQYSTFSIGYTANPHLLEKKKAQDGKSDLYIFEMSYRVCFGK